MSLADLLNDFRANSLTFILHENPSLHSLKIFRLQTVELNRLPAVISQSAIFHLLN